MAGNATTSLWATTPLWSFTSRTFANIRMMTTVLCDRNPWSQKFQHDRKQQIGEMQNRNILAGFSLWTLQSEDFLKIILCLTMHNCFSAHMSAGVRKCQRHWIPLELELQVIYEPPDVGAKTKLRSSARALCTLMCWPSLQPQQFGDILKPQGKMCKGEKIRKENMTRYHS